MKKLLGKDTLILAILTLVTGLIWVGFGVFRALTESEIPKVLKEQIAPMNEKLPREILKQLRDRDSFTKAELNETTIIIFEKTEEGNISQETKDLTIETSPGTTESASLE